MKSVINHPFYLLLRFPLRILLKGIFFIRGFRIAGREHLPRKKEPLMIVSNHAAFVDSVYFICSVRPRIVICGAKPKYFQSFFTRHLFRIANILMVESEGQFVQDCIELLGRGEILLVYPEMGRNPLGMGEFRTWAAKVILSRPVPVLPCYLYGTTEGHQGPKRLIVGTSFIPEGDPEAITGKLRQKILSLNPEKEEKRR